MDENTLSAALHGGKGALDAWLEVNNEAECRAAILALAASGVLPVQQPIDRPIDENALNDAAWMFIDNATGDIPVPLWNNLKLALRPAIECYLSKVATPAAAQQPAIPEGWKLVPIEPTAEIIAAAAIAVWPTALPRDMELGRKAAATVLMEMDLAPGATVESIGAHIATMAPAYRAMIAAAPVLLEDQKP